MKQRVHGRSLWRHGEFMKLWTGETISQVGTQVTLLALPTTAIKILSATPFQVGLLTSVEFLPFILVGLPAGVWVDRLRRRPVLIAGDVGRFLALGSIPIAYELGVLHILQLYAVAFFTGICTVFFDVAYQSYLPSLVDRDQLVEGNSKLEISRSGAQLAGPAIGGILIQILKAPVAVAADALSYVGSAVFVFWVRKKEPSPEAHATKPRMRTQIGEGLRYVWRHPYLRPIAFCTGSSNLFGTMVLAVLLLFAYRAPESGGLGLSPGVVGVALAVGNAGFLLGAFVSRRVTRWLGVGRAIVGGIIVAGTGGILLPLATRRTGAAFIALSMALVGLGAVIYNINQVSLRQAITPYRMQGRMNATMRFMVWGTMPIGGFVGGILGGTIGLRPTLWVAAIGGLFPFLPPLLSPVRKLREMPTEGPAPEATLGESVLAEGDGVVEPGHVPPAWVEARDRGNA
jgi:MFS family permease